MRFADVLFQDQAHDRIQRALSTERLPHAYLFTGLDGVGREMMANRLAAVLLCSDAREVPAPESHQGKIGTWREPCGSCADCRMFAAGMHPDFSRIYRQLAKMHPEDRVRKKKHLELVVDVIRHFVIDPMGRRPSQGRAKVFVIAEGDYLNPNAQNALLKTLEEPPEQSYLVVIANSTENLLPTILSRCSRIEFRALPTEFIEARLIERGGVEPAVATFLAQVAQGSLGETMRLAGLSLHERIPALLDLLAGAGDDPLGCGKGIMEMCADLAKQMKDADDGKSDDVETDAGEGDDDQPATGPELNVARAAQRTFLSILGAILRDVQRVVVGRPAAALPGNKIISLIAARSNTEGIRAAIGAVATTEYQLSANANVKLTFDCLGLGLSRGLSVAVPA